MKLKELKEILSGPVCLYYVKSGEKRGRGVSEGYICELDEKFDEKEILNIYPHTNRVTEDSYFAVNNIFLMDDKNDEM